MEVCEVGSGVVLWTVVYRKVDSVDGSATVVLVKLLTLEDEVSGSGEVGVEGVDEVEAVALKVSSSVICDLWIKKTNTVTSLIQTSVT